jgi:hypothetical protein
MNDFSKGGVGPMTKRELDKRDWWVKFNITEGAVHDIKLDTREGPINFGHSFRQKVSYFGKERGTHPSAVLAYGPH